MTDTHELADELERSIVRYVSPLTDQELHEKPIHLRKSKLIRLARQNIEVQIAEHASMVTGDYEEGKKADQIEVVFMSVEKARAIAQALRQLTGQPKTRSTFQPHIPPIEDNSRTSA